MQFLYKAYACEDMGTGRFLLPGRAVTHEMGKIPPESEIEVVLADGTRLRTMVVSAQTSRLDESVKWQFVGKVPSSVWYEALQVPNDFSPDGIELGADVFLVDSE